jgi:RNA polymerase sigma factor (sigma-70 family)
MHFDASHSSPYPLPPDDVADWESPAAEAAVRAFVAVKGGVPGYGIEDLVQEALIAWWGARRGHDPSRGASPRTYLNHVVRRTLLDLQDAALAQKRGRGVTPRSLDAPLDSDDPESEMLHDVTAGTLPGTDPGAASDHALLAEAIAQAQARLGFSDEDRRLLALRAAGYSPTDMERITGRKRTTINSKLTQLYARLRSPELAERLRSFLD